MGKMIYATGSNSYVELTPVISTSDFLKSSAGKTLLPENLHFFHELRRDNEGKIDGRSCSFLIDTEYLTHGVSNTLRNIGIPYTVYVYGGSDGKELIGTYKGTNAEVNFRTILEKIDTSKSVEVDGKKLITCVVRRDDNAVINPILNIMNIGLVNGPADQNGRNRLLYAISSNMPVAVQMMNTIRYALIDLDSGVETITNAFNNYSFVEAVAIPSTVKIINNCFNGLSRCKYIYGIENIETINGNTNFSNMIALDELELPSLKVSNTQALATIAGNTSTLASVYSTILKIGEKIGEKEYRFKNNYGAAAQFFQFNGGLADYSYTIEGGGRVSYSVFDRITMDLSTSQNVTILSSLMCTLCRLNKFTLKTPEVDNLSINNPILSRTNTKEFIIENNSKNLQLNTQLFDNSTVERIKFVGNLPINVDSFLSTNTTGSIFSKILIPLSQAEQWENIGSNYILNTVYYSASTVGEKLPERDSLGRRLAWTTDIDSLINQNTSKILTNCRIITEGTGGEVYAVIPNPVTINFGNGITVTNESGGSILSGAQVEYGARLRAIATPINPVLNEAVGIREQAPGVNRAEIYPAIYEFEALRNSNLFIVEQSRLTVKEDLFSSFAEDNNIGDLTFVDVNDVSDSRLVYARVPGSYTLLNDGGIAVFPFSQNETGAVYTIIDNPVISDYFGWKKNDIRVLVVPYGIKSFSLDLGQFPNLQCLQLPGSLENLSLGVVPESVKLIYTKCSVDVLRVAVKNAEFQGNTKIVIPAEAFINECDTGSVRGTRKKLLERTIIEISSDRVLPEKLGYNNTMAINVMWFETALANLLESKTNSEILEEHNFTSSITSGVDGKVSRYYGIPYTEYNIVTSHSCKDISEVLLEKPPYIKEEIYFTKDSTMIPMGSSKLYVLRAPITSEYIDLDTYSLVEPGFARGKIKVVGGDLDENGFSSRIIPENSNVIISIPNYQPEYHNSNIQVDFATCDQDGNLTSTNVAGYAITGLRDDLVKEDIYLPDYYNGLPVIAARNLVANCERDDIKIFFPDSIRIIRGSVDRSSKIKYLAKILSIGPNTRIVLPDNNSDFLLNDIEVREGASEFPFEIDEDIRRESIKLRTVTFKEPQTVIAASSMLTTKKLNMSRSNYNEMPLFLGTSIGDDIKNDLTLIHRNRVALAYNKSSAVFEAFGNKFNLNYVDSEAYCEEIARKAPFLTTAKLLEYINDGSINSRGGFFGMHPRKDIGYITTDTITFRAPFNPFDKLIGFPFKYEAFPVDKSGVYHAYSTTERESSRYIGFTITDGINEIILNNDTNVENFSTKVITPSGILLSNVTVSSLGSSSSPEKNLKKLLGSNCVLAEGRSVCDTPVIFDPNSFIDSGEKGIISVPYNLLTITNPPAEGTPFYTGNYFLEVDYNNGLQHALAMNLRSVSTRAQFAEGIVLPKDWNGYQLRWFANALDLINQENEITVSNGSYVLARISVS